MLSEIRTADPQFERVHTQPSFSRGLLPASSQNKLHEKCEPERYSFLIIQYCTLLLIFILRCASESFANISFFVLAAYSLIGPKQRLQAIVFSFLFSMMNVKIFPLAEQAALGRYAILATTTIPGLSALIKPSYWRASNTSFFVMAIAIAIHSLLFSIYPDISFFKIALFALAYISISAAFLSCNKYEIRLLEVEGVTVLFLTSLASLLYYSFGLGMLGDGLGGFFSQPQITGIVAALGCSLSIILYFTQTRFSLNWGILFPVFLTTVVLSRARTGLMAALLGTFSTLTIKPLANARFAYLSMFTAIAFALCWPLIDPLLDSFISKGRKQENLIETAYASRGKLIEAMWDNIQENPYAGIGFGISKFLDDRDVKRDPFFGFAISAPVEKGVLPVAIIEEVGVFVGAFIFSWIAILLREVINGPRESMALALTALATNLAESTLFSPSGLGILILMVLLWSAEKSIRHKLPQ